MNMKVLDTEKNRVLQSNEYTLFKYKKPRLSERKILILMDEMKVKNISKDTPIIVDSEFNILDGVYRYEANKRLGSRIYYKVAEIANKLDLMKASSLSNKPSDWEYVLMHQDKLAYRKVIEWSKVLPYHFTDIIRVLNYSYLTYQNRLYNNMFKNGLMDYTREHENTLKNAKEFSDQWLKLYPELLLPLNDVVNLEHHVPEFQQYSTDTIIGQIVQFIYFPEFLKLKKIGHPIAKDFGAYYDEAYIVSINDSNIIEEDKEKVLQKALELNPWGGARRPILYNIHQYVAKNQL